MPIVMGNAGDTTLTMPLPLVGSAATKSTLSFRAFPVPTLETVRSTKDVPSAFLPWPATLAESLTVPRMTLTIAVAEPTLPLASRNSNVTVVVPSGKSVLLFTLALPNCGGSGTGDGSILSFAVAPARNAARAGHAEPRAPPASVAGIVMLAGGVTTGGWVSPLITVIVKLAAEELPCASMDVHFTVVVPIGKAEPEAGVQMTGTAPSTISVALAANTATAPEELVAVSVRFVGADRIGGVVSRTTIVKLPDEEFPCVSEEEQLAVVVPMANVEPDAGAHTTGRVPSTMSVALAVKLATAPVGPVASSVWFEGKVSAGGVVSWIVMKTLDAPVPPRPSSVVSVMLCRPMGSVVEICAALPRMTAPSDQVKVKGSLSGSEPTPLSVTPAPADEVASTTWLAPACAVGG